MTRILPWIPLATIIGLSISLAILLARPPSNVVVMTIVTPAPAAVAPTGFPLWDKQCRFFEHPRAGLRLNCW